LAQQVLARGAAIARNLHARGAQMSAFLLSIVSGGPGSEGG
jgi:hypothetical protein